jgi:hypothetical protein
MLQSSAQQGHRQTCGELAFSPALLIWFNKKYWHKSVGKMDKVLLFKRLKKQNNI